MAMEENSTLVLSDYLELQVRVALLNRFTQLGRPVTVPVA